MSNLYRGNTVLCWVAVFANGDEIETFMDETRDGIYEQLRDRVDAVMEEDEFATEREREAMMVDDAEAAVHAYCAYITNRDYSEAIFISPVTLLRIASNR
jgi:hypothetical protein